MDPHYRLCGPSWVASTWTSTIGWRGENMKNHQEAKVGLLKPGLMLVALLLVMTAAWAKGGKTPSTVVKLQNGQGKNVGTALLQQSAVGVAIKLNVHDLTPGDH